MTSDEIQEAIDRAEQKRRELRDQQPEAKQSANVLSILPRAAELYRRQIARIPRTGAARPSDLEGREQQAGLGLRDPFDQPDSP